MERVGEISVSTNYELQKAEKQYSVDLAIGANLDKVLQIYKTELLPGEVRVWQDCFRNERPEAIHWGFRQYFKTGKFPPKPADISALISEQRASPYFAGWDEEVRDARNQKSSDVYREKAKESREEFFKSPEYKAFLERMKKEHGI